MHDLAQPPAATKEKRTTDDTNHTDREGILIHPYYYPSVSCFLGKISGLRNQTCGWTDIPWHSRNRLSESTRCNRLRVETKCMD